MIEWIKTIASTHHAELSCYITASLVGILVAVVELLSRYGAGNSPRWVLFGIPQIFYYLINVTAAAGGLFASEAFDQTAILKLYEMSPSAAICKSFLLALASMFALRSSVFSIETKQEKSKIDIGPAQILNVLGIYLVRQIDKVRSAAVLREISKVMDGIDPADIYPDILVCLIAAESVPEQTGAQLKKDLDNVFSSNNWSIPQTKAIAMGLHIQRELGAKTLKLTINLLRELVAKKKTSTSKGADQEPAMQKNLLQSRREELKSVDVALDAEFMKLKTKG